MVHWSMLPDADRITIGSIYPFADAMTGEVYEDRCLCDKGMVHVTAKWPTHGWAAHAGQCCNCMNIRVFSNGAEPADFESGDPGRIEFAEEESDEIHICDLTAFIEFLTAIQNAKVAAMRGT